MDENWVTGGSPIRKFSYGDDGDVSVDSISHGSVIFDGGSAELRFPASHHGHNRLLSTTIALPGIPAGSRLLTRQDWSWQILILSGLVN